MNLFRFLPFFALGGAGIEYLMINWRPYDVNFYEVYKRKEAKKIAAERLNNKS